MITFNIRTGTGNRVLAADFNAKNVFIAQNDYSKANMTNSTYDPIEYPIGLILGRVAATGEVVPCESTATDGSQYPVGILSETITIDGGDTLEVPFCVAGHVAEEMVVTTNSDTLETVIEDKMLRDRIGSDTVGIFLRLGDDQTNFDN